MDVKQRYEEFFREADKDNSNYLDLDELVEVMRKKGYKGTDAQIKVSSGLYRCDIVKLWYIH